MPDKSAVQEKWDKEASKLLASEFGDESWWNDSNGCATTSDPIPCDNKQHIRTFGGGMVLHHYRGGHGWQPLRVYKKPKDLGPVRHTHNKTGGSHVTGVHAAGGDTYHANEDGSTAERTNPSPYWPEEGDYDQHGERIEDAEDLGRARWTFAWNAWARANDEDDYFDWLMSISCERDNCTMVEREVDIVYAKGHTWTTMTLTHDYLAVCLTGKFKCRVEGPTTRSGGDEPPPPPPSEPPRSAPTTPSGGEPPPLPPLPDPPPGPTTPSGAGPLPPPPSPIWPGGPTTRRRGGTPPPPPPPPDPLPGPTTPGGGVGPPPSPIWPRRETAPRTQTLHAQLRGSAGSTRTTAPADEAIERVMQHWEVVMDVVGARAGEWVM